MGAIFLLLSHMLMTTLMVNFYLGEYMAIVINPKYVRPPIDYMEQWRESKMEWVHCLDSDRYYFLILVGQLSGLTNRIHNCNFTDQYNVNLGQVKTFNELIDKPDDLVTFFWPNKAKALIDIYKLKPKDGRKFYFSKSTIAHIGHANLYYPHNSYLKEGLNRAITLTNDMGFITHIEEISRFPIHMKARVNEPKFTAEEILRGQLMKFKHFVGGLVILGVGYGIAILSLLGEMLFHRHEAQFLAAMGNRI